MPKSEPHPPRHASVDDTLRMTVPLWTHQQTAIRQVAARLDVNRGGSVMVARMGGGKTRAVLETLRRVGAQRIIVVGPRAVCEDVDNGWPHEVEAHGNYWPVTILTRGPGRKRAERVAALGTGRWLITLNYHALLIKPLLEALLASGADALVIDEIHRASAPNGSPVTPIKGRRKRSTSNTVSRKCADLANVCYWRIGLTGTPFSGSLGALALWQYYQIIAPHLLMRSYTKFRNYITETCERGKHSGARPISRDGQLEYYRWKNLDWHGTAWDRLAWTVKEAPVLDALPVPMDLYRDATLEPKARRLYTRLERDHAVMLRDEPWQSISAPNVLARMTRLRQLTSGWFEPDEPDVDGTVISTAKRDLLVDVLTDVWEPVVVFAVFHHELDSIHAACEKVGLPSFEISGRSSADSLRQWRAHARAWQRNAQHVPPVLAIQIQSGAEGLTLVESALGVFYSKDYSLLMHDQARGRLVRPGQTRKVRFIHMQIPDTIDTAISQALIARKDFVDALAKGVVRWPEKV